MGEWGWVIAAKATDLGETILKKRILAEDFADIPTRFLNRDAMISMAHFGKGVLDSESLEKIEVNTESNPVLYRYYLAGSWGMY